MTTKTYDTKPAFDPSKPYEPIAENKPAFDPNKSFEPVKKKDVGTVTSKTSSMGGTTAQKPVIDPANGLEVLQTTPEQDALYERTKQRASQITGETPNLDDDPIGNVTKPYKDKALSAHNELRTLGTGNKNVSESTGQNKKVEAGKANMQSALATDSKKSFQELEDVTNHLSNSLFPNGKEAEIYLQRKSAEKGGELPENNQTVEIAKNKAAKYEYLKDILSKGSLDQMAVEIMRQNDPNLDKQISVLEQAKGGTRAGAHGYQTPQDIYQNIIPAVQQARYIDDMLHDPDVKIIAQEDPKVKADFDKLSNGGLYEIYPEYGEKVVRNRLSRAREQAGRNNIIANPIFNSSKYMDKLAEKEFADEPVLLNIYNQKLKGNLEGKIDTSGAIDEFGTGAKHTYQQMGNTIADVMGLGKTEDERIYSQLENQYGNVNSGVTGWKKNVGTASNFLGMMGAMGSLGAPLRVTGLTGNAANAVITADAFYDSELNNWTMKYPGEPWKAQMGAITSTALFAAGQKAFPSTKIADAIVGKMEPAIQDAVNKLNEGAVEKAVRDNLVKKFGNVLKETVKGTAEATTHMVAISAFQNAMDHVLGLDDKTMSKYHPDNEIVDVAKNMIIGSAFPQFMMAYGNRNAVANSLYSIAENPIRFSEMLQRSAEENPDAKTQIDQKLQDVQFLSQTKKLLDEHNVTPDNQKRYLLEAMNEKYAADKAKNTADKTLSDQSKDSIKESQEIKEGILAGQNADEVMTTKKVDAEKEQVKAEADRNKLIEKGHTAIDKLLEEKDENEENVFKGLYRDIAKKDPVGFLEDIAGQINGVQRKEGDKVESDQLLSDLEHKLIKKYGADIVNVAKELFPYKEPISSKISVQMPEEVENQRRDVTTIAPKEQVPEPKSKGAAIILPKPRENESAPSAEENTAVNEPEKTEQPAEVIAGANEGGEIPPPENKKSSVSVERPDTELSHRGLQNVANEFSLPDVKTREKKTDIELRKDAEDTINDWIDEKKYSGKVEGLVKKAEGGEVLTDKERVILEQHLANLSGELREMKSNSPEFDAKLAEIKRLKDAGEKTRSEAGAALRIATFGSRPKDISDYYVQEMEAAGVEKLTEEQKQTVEKEFDTITETEKKYEEKIQSLKDENAKMRAELEVKKAAKTAKKGEKKDFKKEREDIVQSIQDKLKKARGDASATIVPYAKELFAIAPDVAKLVRSYAEQGVTELADMVKKIHEDLKPVIPNATLKDVNDLIAGEYNEKKATRNELAATLRDLRDEAKLINKLEALENGEAPKDAKKKIERNRNITQLRDKIKNFEKIKSDNEADGLKSYKKKSEAKIKELEYKLKTGDFDAENAPAKQPLKLDKEATDLRDKLLKLKEDREIRLMEEEYGKLNTGQKILRGASKFTNVGRVLKSSFDVSMPFRQGLWGLSRQLLTVPIGKGESGKLEFTGFKKQKELGQEFGKMYQSLASETVSRRIMADIHESPRYELAQKSGLNLADPNSRLAEAREEIYGPSGLEGIPFLGKSIEYGKDGKRIGGLIKSSERAATTFVNTMKWNIFNELVDQFERHGKTFKNSESAYKAAADYANQAVGRGKLPESVEKANAITSKIFFSLRLAASRLQLMTNLVNPRFYARVPKEVREAYWKDTAKFVLLGMSILATAHAAGLSVGINPWASNFGKVKVGNTEYDIWGGFSQWATFLIRAMSGKTAGTNGELKSKNRLDIISHFGRGKASPEASLVINSIEGKDYLGQETNVGKEALNYINPLISQDVIQATKDGGVMQGMVTFLLASHGVGTQTYDHTATPEKKKHSTEKKERKHSK